MMPKFNPPGFPADQPPLAKQGWEHSTRVLVYYAAIPEICGDAWGIAYYHYKPPFDGAHWIDAGHYDRTPTQWWPLPVQQEGESVQNWTPNMSRFGYLTSVIEAMCTLWPAGNDDIDVETVCKITEHKLNSVWAVEYANFAESCKVVCCKAFWDMVMYRYPSGFVYSVEVIFDETLNPNKDAKKVCLYITPAKMAMRVQLNLDADAKIV